MKNKRFIILLLLLSVFLAGCVNLFDPETLIKNNAQVQSFMEDYPNADLTLVQYSLNESEQLIGEISDNCGKEIEKQPLYKFEIEDPDSGLNMVGYINSNTQQFVCVKKRGSGGDHSESDHDDHDYHDEYEDEIIPDDYTFLEHVEVESKGFDLNVEILDLAQELDLELSEVNFDFEAEIFIMKEDGVMEVEDYVEGELKNNNALEFWNKMIDWAKNQVETTEGDFVGVRLFVSTFEDHDDDYDREYDYEDEREDEEDYYDEDEFLEVHYEIDADIDFSEEFKETLYELKEHLYENNREIEFEFEIEQNEDGEIEQEDEIEGDRATEEEGDLWNKLINMAEKEVKSHEGHEVFVRIEIEASFEHDDHDKHDYGEEEHDMDDLVELCEDVKGGDFDHEYGECIGIGQDSCEYIGGEFDECASPCRHEDDTQACIAVCEEVCYFDDYEKDYDDHDDHYEHEEEIEVEITIFNDGSEVFLEIDGDEKEFTLVQTDLDEIIEKIMEEFDLSKDEIYDHKELEYEDEYLFKDEDDHEHEHDDNDEHEEEEHDEDEHEEDKDDDEKDDDSDDDKEDESDDDN